MELTTARLLLRPFKREDAPELARLLNDLDITKWLGTAPYPYDLADAEEFLHDNADNTPDVFAIDDAIGLAGAVGVKGELGYWIAKRSWGQGYAFEAAVAAVSQYFIDPDNEELIAAYFSGNEKSRQIQKKLHFKDNGQRNISCRATGDVKTCTSTKLLRSDWIMGNST